MLIGLFRFLHKLLFTWRLRIRQRSWNAATQVKPEHRKIVVSGFFNEALGTGSAGHLIADRLESLGHDIIREDLRPFDRGLATRPLFAFEAGKQSGVWLIVANPPETKIALFTHDPAVWKSLYRIGVWHWESNLPPFEWIELAEYFHEIWVSTKFCEEGLIAAFRKFGMEGEISKISIHPLPVRPANHIEQDQRGPVGAITLFDSRSHFERKNPIGVVKAWIAAFPTPECHRHLTVKTLDISKTEPRFASLLEMVGSRPDITVLAATLSAGEVRQLISRNQVLISLHRGEGFGLPLAEAMASGVAVIATGWSGNTEFMNEHNSVLVPYTLVPAPKRYNGPEAKWAEPDLDAASILIKEVMADRARRDRMIEKAKHDIDSIYASWEQNAAYLKNFGND